jgi:hypothetical protein
MQGHATDAARGGGSIGRQPPGEVIASVAE